MFINSGWQKLGNPFPTLGSIIYYFSIYFSSQTHLTISHYSLLREFPTLHRKKMITMKIRAIVVATIVLMISYGVSAQQAPGPAPMAASGPSAPAPMAAFGPSAPAPMVDFGPSASAPGDECLNSLYNMSDCLTYVTTGSNLTKPDKACCPELAGLVDSQPVCLCELLGSAASYGIDVNRALKLPSICGVSTPSVSLCAVLGVPVGVPLPSEETSPGAQPPGVAASPTTGNNGNGACNITGSSLAFLVGLAIAFLSTFF